MKINFTKFLRVLSVLLLCVLIGFQVSGQGTKNNSSDKQPSVKSISLSTSNLAPKSISNNQGVNLTAQQGHQGNSNGFRTISNQGGTKSMSGGVTCTTSGYIAGTTQILNFTLVFTSPDYEYCDGVSLTFPAGMVPQTTGTSDPLATANGCGPTMALNPITGQTVIWGQITAPTGCGALIPGTYNFSVAVAIDAGLTGSQNIAYYVMGDGYGGTPHSLSGTTSINAAAAADVGVQSVTMSGFYISASPVTPSAIVQNYGTTAQTFNVSIAINNGTSDVYTDTKTVTSLAAGTTSPVSFNNWTAIAGNYTATVTTLLAGDGNPGNDSKNKLFVVGSMPAALTGNTSDGLYQGVNMVSGALTNYGTIGSSPFPMAEEYNGVSIYRVYDDFSFGTVAFDGTFTLLGTLTGVTGTPTGLAWNWATSQMYVVVLNASNLPQLCTINLGTLAMTLIGTGTAGMIIGMDFANDGYLYGPSLNPDNLYRIDPATGATTSVGPLGIDINYGQDVSFDLATNQLYTISLTGAGVSQFGTYDLVTGAFTMIADENGKQHATFVITNLASACPPPSLLTVGTVTISSADLTWTAGGSEGAWNVEVGLPGFSPGTGSSVFKTAVNTNYVTATPLASGTAYQAYVQADCGNGVSAWVGPKPFRTPMECPQGSTAELEVCGTTTNDGCNLTVPTFENIAVGQTICGTSYYDGTNRDLDWYSFTLASAANITLSGSADFDLQLFITSTCPATILASGTALTGITASASTQLVAGTYYAVVGPQFTGVFSCTQGYKYQVTLSSSPITAYCTPAPTSVDNLGITNVTYSTVNNTTGAESGNYGDYSALVGDVQRTATIPVAITFQTGYTYDTKIWIDWNDNFTFLDPGEEVYVGVSTSSSPTTLSASFVVPVSASLGNHRMRIGGVDVGPPTPCYTGSYGTFEDYTVNVLPAPACPAPSNQSAIKHLNSADLSWTENGSATLWDIELGVAGFSPTGVPTANNVASNTLYTYGSLLSGTTYEWYVRADCAGDDVNVSSWVGPNSFTTLLCDPVDQCNYTFRMTDAWGDGWNGNTMAVKQGGITIQTLSLSTGNGPVDVPVGLCHGINFELYWNTGGSYPEEVGVEILDPFGVSIYSKPPGTGSQNTSLYTGSANCNAAKTLNLKVFLEGPYAGSGAMTTALNSMLPLTSPYTPGETVTTIPSTDIVDWVLVEPRIADAPENATSATTLAGWPKSCFLKSDGSIVALDGTSLPDVGNPTIIPGNYMYVVVRHRNHLSVMSNFGLSLEVNSFVYDFSTAVTQAYGGASGYKELRLSPGVFGMVDGDADGDLDIGANDFTVWSQNIGLGGYAPTDIDMDADIGANDFTEWSRVIGLTNIGVLPSKVHSQGLYKCQVPK